MSSRKRTRELPGESGGDGGTDASDRMVFEGSSSSSPASSARKKKRTPVPDGMPAAAAAPAAAAGKLTREEQRRIAQQSLAAQEATRGFRDPSGGQFDGPLPNRHSPASVPTPATSSSAAVPAAGKLTREEQRRIAQQSLAAQEATRGFRDPSGGQFNGPSPNHPPAAAAANRGPSRPSLPPSSLQAKAFPAAKHGVTPPARLSVASRLTPPVRDSPAPPLLQSNAPSPPPAHAPPASAVPTKVRAQQSAPLNGNNDASSSSVHEEHWREEGADVFHLLAPGARAWRTIFNTLLGLSLAVVLFLIKSHGGPTITQGLLELAPAAVKTVLLGDPPPCFAPSDASEQQQQPPCALGESDDSLLPCPPQSVCRGGEIIACGTNGDDDDLRLWTAYKPDGSTAVTYCVPSVQALAVIALASKALEPWSWPSSCLTASSSLPSAKEVGEAPESGALVSGHFKLYPYDAVMREVRSELERIGQAAEAASVDPVQFVEVARGRLSTQWKKDETGASSLWIGLLPTHKKHLPSVCRASLSIISLGHYFGGVAGKLMFFVKDDVFIPSASFLKDVFLMVYWTNPATVALAVLGPALFAIFWWRSVQRRREREAHDADVHLVYAAAIDILVQADEPVRCLALRDEVRDRVQGRLQGNQFNNSVWPDVQTRLESDQRITQRMVQRDVALSWSGPRRNL